MSRSAKAVELEAINLRRSSVAPIVSDLISKSELIRILDLGPIWIKSHPLVSWNQNAFNRCFARRIDVMYRNQGTQQKCIVIPGKLA
jgi:hypothetical protein